MKSLPHSCPASTSVPGSLSWSIIVFHVWALGILSEHKCDSYTHVICECLRYIFWAFSLLAASHTQVHLIPSITLWSEWAVHYFLKSGTQNKLQKGVLVHCQLQTWIQVSDHNSNLFLTTLPHSHRCTSAENPPIHDRWKLQRYGMRDTRNIL